jgi:hypothetical protein
MDWIHKSNNLHLGREVEKGTKMAGSRFEESWAVVTAPLAASARARRVSSRGSAYSAYAAEAPLHLIASTRASESSRAASTIVSIANCLSPASDRLISVTRNRVKCNERWGSPAVTPMATGSSKVLEDGVRTPRRFLADVSAPAIRISRYAIVSQLPTFEAQISGPSE